MARLVFEGQREREEVCFVFRRHRRTAKKGLVFLFAMIAIGILPLILWPGDTRMIILFFVFISIGFLGLAYVYLLWYFSVYIVTNQRIRQIRQKGLFKKSVMDLGLDKIQSISYGTSGVMGGILNYGTILIQTGVGDLTISMVPNPEKIYNKLQDTAKKAEEEK